MESFWKGTFAKHDDNLHNKNVFLHLLAQGWEWRFEEDEE